MIIQSGNDISFMNMIVYFRLRHNLSEGSPIERERERKNERDRKRERLSKKIMTVIVFEPYTRII